METVASLCRAAPTGRSIRAVRAVRAVGEAVGTLADLALPTVCAGCGMAGMAFCPECSAELTRASAYPQIVAGRAGRACLPDGVVVAAAPYEGVVRRAVVAYKDGDRRDLIRVLGPVMRAALVTASMLVPLDGGTHGGGRAGRSGRSTPGALPIPVVPAPSSARSRRARGDVPTHRLVREALRGADALVGSWAWAPVLRHTRRVSDQASLTRAQRAVNTDHAFRVAGPAAWLCGREVVVADDVVTTGATARECVRALRAVGARPVAVVALAATPASRGAAQGVGTGEGQRRASRVSGLHA